MSPRRKNVKSKLGLAMSFVELVRRLGAVDPEEGDESIERSKPDKAKRKRATSCPQKRKR
jgi:hypothetical protein